MTNNDDPTRKKNYKAVERELWILSGNECAFEGCTTRLVNEDGSYVGEIAHIRGVRPTSPRHDPTMDDDDLRDKSNLILLCRVHHKITDDESRYAIKRMEEMKERHESRFRSAYAEFEAQFIDYTDFLQPGRCRTLTRWLDVLGLHGPDFDNAYIEDEARKLNELADQLSSLTNEARALFSFVVARGAEDQWHNSYHFPLSELARRTKQTRSRILDILNELERLDFGHIDPEPGDGPPEVVVYAPTGDQRFHSEHLTSLRAFCEQGVYDLDEFIVNLRFELLDS